MIHPSLPPSWSIYLQEELEKPYFIKMMQTLEEAYHTAKIYPPKEQIFHAFQLTPLDSIKVVVLGQDPYHKKGQAMGLSFSVPSSFPCPPSLKNIFKELSEDLKIPLPTEGDLTPWAKQGVFLLNTILTVEEGKPNSHENLGWKPFTDAVISCINNHCSSVVFILWGSHAQGKIKQIDSKKHIILTAPHPSPLSSYRGFFGSRPFSQANNALSPDKINWTLP